MDFSLDDYLKQLEDEETFPTGELTSTPPTMDATSDIVKSVISSKFNPEALQEAQAKANENRLAVNLADAGSDLSYAIAGVQRPRTDNFDDYRKMSDAPVAKTLESEKLKLQKEKMVSDAVKNRIKAQEDEKFRKASLRLRSDAIQANKDLKGAIMGVNERKYQEKKAEDDAELNVPGFERDPNIRPLPAEAQKVRDGVAELKNFERDIDKYIKLVQKHGGFEVVGKDAGIMSALATGLKLQQKNLQQLGVLAGPDMGLIDTLINDPVGFKSLLTSKPTALATLGQTKEQTIQNALGKIAARGYKPIGGKWNSSGGAVNNGGGAPNFEGMTDEELKAYLGQ